MDGCSSSGVPVHRRRSGQSDIVSLRSPSEGPPEFTSHPTARGQSPWTASRGGCVRRQGSSSEIGGRNGSSGRDGPHFREFTRGIEDSEGPVPSPPRGGSHCFDTKDFIERARKRIVACQAEVSHAQEALVKAQSKLHQEEQGLSDGEARLATLMQESAEGGPEWRKFSRRYLPILPTRLPNCALVSPSCGERTWSCVRSWPAEVAKNENANSQEVYGASAGVAVPLTLLATTVQLARHGRFALESAAARVCREAGARVTTNVMVRDLDLEAMNMQDGRRLGVVADGLPLHGGAQLATDTTIVSALRCDGTPHICAANVDGLRLAAARRRKERAYPEFVAPRSHCRLVVLATEVGGRWSTEALVFLRLLARAKARSEPHLMRARAQQTWKLRWLSILGCASARAVAASLLGLRGHGGADGAAHHLHEVEGDFRGAF